MSKREKTIVLLGGVNYEFRTPKVAPVLSAIVRMKGKEEIEQMQILFEAQAKWLRSGVGDEAWRQIEQRLADEDDELDWTDISQLFQDQMSADSGRPSTSSSESSASSPKTSSSEDEPKQQESIFGI